MSYDIEKQYDYLLKKNEIEFDQKQFDLLRELSKKSKEFLLFANNHSISIKNWHFKSKASKGHLHLWASWKRKINAYGSIL